MMDTVPESELSDLLIRLFSSEELVAFLLRVGGPELLAAVDVNRPMEHLAVEAVLAMSRRNWITPAFFIHLERSRPRQIAQIAPVRKHWEHWINLQTVSWRTTAAAGTMDDGDPLRRMAHLWERLRCVEAWVPSKAYEDASDVNDLRNEAKRQAIRRAAAVHGHVQLLAETGRSYLSSDGAFYREIRELLKNGGRFTAIIGNRYFLSGHCTSQAYFEPNRLDGDGLHEAFKGRMSNVDRGYDELRKIPSGRVELKVARYMIPTTILLTSDVVFFEPYLYAGRDRRHLAQFNTFELLLERGADDAAVFKVIEEHFEFFDEHSSRVNSVEAKSAAYLELLRSLQRLWA